jgi:hypothetical protein
MSAMIYLSVQAFWIQTLRYACCFAIVFSCCGCCVGWYRYLIIFREPEVILLELPIELLSETAAEKGSSRKKISVICLLDESMMLDYINA